MSTPICDFVRRYVGGGAVRMHMPGHKGCGPLGCEALDITEIDGADDLFHPEGIIAQSEENAGAIFGAHTLYATGGSTLCIQTMVQLLAVYARSRGQRPLLLAGRNAHKAFVNAAALLDVPVRWLCPAEGEAYYSGAVTPEQLERELACSREPVTAVYLTCPDYLGELPDVAALAAVCRRAGVLLAVDNAHGAYLKFLSPSRHPMDLGADLCCDSAHKTLPVVTGGAYLHIAHQAPELLHRQAKASMGLWGSSSPSYLILQSLLALVFISLLGFGTYNVILALGIAFIPSYARVIRGEFARQREMNYVKNARLMGASHLRIMLVHILPNTRQVLLPTLAIGFNNAVLAEASMSFLGIGVKPPEVSLGYMMSESQSYMVRAPWYMLTCGSVIVLLILGVSLIGEGLQQKKWGR